MALTALEVGEVHPAFKVGGSWRFRSDEIESWIKENQNA